MSAPTGDPKLTAQLNELLGQELGRTPTGDSIYQWEWSENLFWPSFATGRTTIASKVMNVPILGGGTEEVRIEEVVPEYTRERQVRLRDTWYLTKWLPAVALIWGWVGGHGHEAHDREPEDEVLRELWESRFPGADFPARGWRIPTDAWLPRSPDDPRVPTLADTRFFISQVKRQAEQKFDQALAGWMEADDAANAAQRRVIEDEVRDAFPAFLNPTPGRKTSGGDWPVSFPSTTKVS